MDCSSGKFFVKQLWSANSSPRLKAGAPLARLVDRTVAKRITIYKIALKGSYCVDVGEVCVCFKYVRFHVSFPFLNHKELQKKAAMSYTATCMVYCPNVSRCFAHISCKSCSLTPSAVVMEQAPSIMPFSTPLSGS